VVRVLKDHPGLDQVIPLHRRLTSPGLLLAEIRALRRAGYDLIFDCGNWSDPSVTSAIVARLAAGQRPLIGPAVWPSTWLHSLSVRPLPGVASEILQRLHLLSVVPGLQPNESLSFRKPVVRSSFKPFLERLQTRRFAVLNPGGRLGWRRVPAEVFSSVGNALLSSGVLPVITFGPGEEDLAKEVVSGAAGSLLAPPTDLDELAAVMELAQMSVCNNSGPMHLSIAVGTPTLGLFVKMDVARWGHPNPPHRMLDLTAEFASIPRACELVTAQVKELMNSLGKGRQPVREHEAAGPRRST
jgi:ADP-heptose:LPS heptosyltransferase